VQYSRQNGCIILSMSRALGQGFSVNSVDHTLLDKLKKKYIFYIPGQRIWI